MNVMGMEFQRLDDRVHERLLLGATEDALVILELISEWRWDPDSECERHMWIWSVDHWHEDEGTVRRDNGRVWFECPEDAVINFKNVWVSCVIQEEEFA